MIRKITAADRDVYISMAKDFYNSDAVSHSVDARNFEKTFDELMARDTYAEGYILQADGMTAGYALLAKTFSQEAGGMVVWVEELYILPEFRGRGLGSEFLKHIQGKLGKEISRIRLEASECNRRAVKLYKALGFTDLEYGQLFMDADAELQE